MKNKKLTEYLILRWKSDEPELLRILEKISQNKKISKKELMVLDKWSEVEINFKDYLYLSKNKTHELIQEFLDDKLQVMCDLTDREGKIGEFIKSVENNFDDETSKVHLYDGKITYLTDKFLYNLNWKEKKKYYSLTSQGEYFEKITIDK